MEGLINGLAKLLGSPGLQRVKVEVAIASRRVTSLIEHLRRVGCHAALLINLLLNLAREQVQLVEDLRSVALRRVAALLVALLTGQLIKLEALGAAMGG